MLSEHNPIAELVHQIQQKWMSDVSPQHELKLVRWLIKPEEARLYEGFLRLESTEHGALPEVLVTMLTPFEHGDSYATSLIKDWTTAYANDTKTQQSLLTKKGPIWQPTDGLDTVNSDEDNTKTFLSMLTSFKETMVASSMNMVVALFPHSIRNMDGFSQWLAALLKAGIPQGICFMVFDHVGEGYLDKLFLKNPDQTKSLHLNLDLDGAVSKIAKMGNSNSPEVKLRECILEMGQAVQKKNIDRLNQWGEKALAATQKSGIKSLYASAHIVYAGMLFNFKDYRKIDTLLTGGLAIAKQGLSSDAASCRPLVIQYYGYIAASNQLQKKMREAIAAFEKQGDTAIEYGLPGMALTPYRQAYTLAKRNAPERHEALLQKAFTVGKSLSGEERQHSCLPGIALDFLRWQEDKRQWEAAAQTDNQLAEIFGQDWKEMAKNPATINQPSTIPVN